MTLKFAITIALLSLSGLASAASNEQPNFVWLISEDNSKHYLKLFDEHGVETPNIARLADQGLLFRHAFSNAPVCSVARTTLMTGCYGPRIGSQFHRKAQLVPLPEGVEMFPALLRKAGYYATNNQKKDYNVFESDSVWDESSRKATWRNRSPDQPFFHMQTFTQSHEGSLHFSRQKFESATLNLPDSMFVAPYHPQTELFRYTNTLYRQRIQTIDQQVGKVVEQLKSDGELENTFVFYFGDHGGVLPRSKGYLFESGLHVPLVVRVPENFKHLVNLDTESTTQIDGFVSFIDFGPTLLNLAGLKVPDAVDGRPFLGKSIEFKELNARNTTLGYADRFDEKSDLVRSLRKGRWKYLRNYEPFNFDGMMNNYRFKMLAYREWQTLFAEGSLDAIQSQFFLPKPSEALFDLRQDPHETNNLAGDPKFQKTLLELRSELSGKLNSWPDLGFYPESYLLAEAFDNPTEFGRSRQTQIARLVEIANLQLLDFPQAKVQLKTALQSEDPWERYWGAIVCSSFGQNAKSLLPMILAISENDPELLVRVRAAEYMGITGLGDPAPIIENALQRSTSRVETALMLNTIVMLRDGHGCQFDIKRVWFEAGGKQDNVERRLEYLLGD